MKKRYVISLDEGTTSCRTVVYDIKTQEIVLKEQKSFAQYYPHPGWVEQDPNEIWKTQKSTLDKVLKTINPEEVIGLGITNQRETVIAWDKATGKPVYNAIVWQCRRTSADIDNISPSMKNKIKNKTGLIPNAYFSASKIKWLFDNVPAVRLLADKNQLCVGTVDSFLAYKLTGHFVTDTTNASRTMLFNINTLEWDDELLKYFNIPKSCLPTVVDSDQNLGMCTNYPFPLCGIIGDQQASLVGQSCIRKGMAKATYGTGCFILLNAGNEVVKTQKMLCSVGYTIHGRTTYVLEGSVYSACSAIDWLKSNMNMYKNVQETADICNNVKSTDGVYFVPAFTGLGAPYWNDNAKGAILGLTLGTTKDHIIRACIESIAYNTNDVIQEMTNFDNALIKELHVDGGGSKNKFLLQFQADILGETIIKSKFTESTALGAIYMVLLSQNLFSLKDIENNYRIEAFYTPTKSTAERNALISGWENAVRTTIHHKQ